jgi:hypothetical protein
MTSKNNHKISVSFAQESEREEICKLARQDHELRQGLKKSPIGQKLDFANHPYLCKGPKKFVKFIFAKRNCAKKKQVGEKWVYDDCSYLCKGLF